MTKKSPHDFEPSPGERLWQGLTRGIAVVFAACMCGFWTVGAITFFLAIFGNDQEGALAACNTFSILAVLSTLLHILFKHGIFEALWLAVEFLFTRE